MNRKVKKEGNYRTLLGGKLNGTNIKKNDYGKNCRRGRDKGESN